MGDGNGNEKIAEAVEGKRWNEARFLMAVKVARMLDKTESPRDAKALALSLEPLVDTCEKSRIGMDGEATPLDHILAQAEELSAEVG